MPLHIASDQHEIVWHGSFFVHHSLALVNRELTLALLDATAFTSAYSLRLQDFEQSTFDAGDDVRLKALASRMAPAALNTRSDMRVTVRHRWPPEFRRPESGKLVLIQPWEFGSLPEQWVSSINAAVDEVWVPSNWVRETYLSSGVSADKVVVVPNGVNIERFHSNVVPLDLASNPATRDIPASSYKFLFVGGTIARKGIDILLDAYERAFTAADDVVLIVKDFGTESFYANQGAAAQIRVLQAKSGAPRVVYLNDDMSEADVAGLYAACDCLVHPYRGEGYGLPIAEAMACGKPTVLTGFGAALDFADDQNAYLIPATRENLPERQISGMATVGQPFWARPDAEALIGLLRHVAENREEAAAKGKIAAAHIAAKHTWAHAAQIVVGRLAALCASGTQAAVSPLELTLPMGLGGLNLASLDLGLSIFKGMIDEAPVGASYEERKQAALNQTRKGNWMRAAEELEACLQERPDDWDVVNAHSVALFRSGYTDKALTLLRRGATSAPHPRDFHHNLAYILLDSGDAPQALQHGLSALEYTKDSAEILKTVEKSMEAVLRGARAILRSLPDSRRAEGKRDPKYREAMKLYSHAQNILQDIKEGVTATAVIGNPDAAPKASARLSLCMIVKNEERFLRNCLESAKDIVDEIVVVDTGSTDGTKAIAREFGALIVDHPWNDDFAEARNISLQHATGDWALWLDADEEIAPESADRFREVIDGAPNDVGGYMVMFRNWLTSAARSESSEMAVHHACRLFRRVPGVHFEGRIHEQNVRSLQSLGYRPEHVEGLVIDHFGYAGEIMTLRNKHERFIRMLKREVDECPVEEFRLFHLFNLGNAYFTQGDMENAAHYLGVGAQSPDAAEEFTVTMFVELATSLHRLNRSWEGLEVCDRADAVGIRQAGIEFARGYCLLHLERYEEAEIAFMTALQLGKEDESVYAKSGDSGVGGYKAQYGLALALVGQDRYDEAETACRAALEDHDSFVEARYLLSIALTRLDWTSEACRELEVILEMNPNHFEACRDLAAILYASRDYSAAYPHVRRVAQRELGDYDAQARYASCAEQLGKLDEAKSTYERLRALAPLSAEVCVNLGRVLAESGSESMAIDCFSEAIQLDPRNGNAYFNAGDILYRLRYYANAAETYLAGLQVEPGNSDGFFTLGNCYYHTGDFSAAVMVYLQALAGDPGNDKARANLALAEEGLTQSERAA